MKLFDLLQQSEARILGFWVLQDLRFTQRRFVPVAVESPSR
jgi:hypothetical protein